MNRDGFSLLTMGFNGKEALDWKIKFIEAFNEMEKQIANPAPILPQNYKEALIALVEKVEQNEKLAEVNAVMLPKAEFYDTVIQSDEEFTIQQVASILANKGMGRNNLFKYLISKGVLSKSHIPYRNQIEADRFRTVEIPWVHPKTNRINITIQVVVTQRGIDHIRKLLKEDGYKIC